MKALSQHLAHLDVKRQLVQANKNEENAAIPDKFSHEPGFGLRNQVVYFGQIRDINPEPTKFAFMFFTKSKYKNCEPVQSDPKNYTQIFLCRDLSEHQNNRFFSEIKDYINKTDAEGYLMHGILPDLGNDLHLRNEGYQRAYIFQVVKVNLLNESGDNFALVVRAHRDMLDIFWLLTKEQVTVYSENPGTPPETLQELRAAALRHRELLITNWRDRISIACVRAGPIPVRLDPNPSLAFAGHYCRFFCECLPSGGCDGEGGASRDDRGSVQVRFDRRWTVRRVAGHEGRRGLDAAASEAVARWVAARAVCEVRARRRRGRSGKRAAAAMGWRCACTHY